MAKRVKVEFDKGAMRKIEQQAKKNLEPFEAKANAAAANESTPANKAHAYARAMKRHGVEVDERGLVREYEALMNE